MLALWNIFPHLDFYRSYLAENLPLLIHVVFLVLAIIFMLTFLTLYNQKPQYQTTFACSNPCYGMTSRVLEESSKDFSIFVKRGI